MYRKIVVLGLLTGLFACTTTTQKVVDTVEIVPKEVLAKNVILMIGDGMGLGQITAGMYANGNRLNLERFPVVGLQKTYAYDNLITDSAASATAIACGVKTYNSAIGVDKDTLAVKSILEEAEEQGLRTGLIATSTIVHATPAAFVSHQPFRSLYEYIAKDLLESNIDLFMGGGLKFFNTQRTDEEDLIPKFQSKGYTVLTVTDGDIDRLDIGTAQKLAYFTANDAPIPERMGRDYLPNASLVGAKFLDRFKKQGFFLMIEGSQIDWGGHANNTEYITSEVIDFDKAVGKVLDFAKRDKETLVIVTADHETGGFAINPKSTIDSLVGAFTSTNHSGTMVPVFAYGPKAELFTGIYENTAIHEKMRIALGFDKKDVAE